MDKCCKLSLQGSVNYYSSSDFCIMVKQPQWAQWCSCSGQPGGSNQLLTALGKPWGGFFWWVGKLVFGKRGWLSYDSHTFKWLCVEHLRVSSVWRLLMLLSMLSPSSQASADVFYPGLWRGKIPFVRPLIVTQLLLQRVMWTGRTGQRDSSTLELSSLHLHSTSQQSRAVTLQEV